MLLVVESAERFSKIRMLYERMTSVVRERSPGGIVNRTMSGEKDARKGPVEVVIVEGAAMQVMVIIFQGTNRIRHHSFSSLSNHPRPVLSERDIDKLQHHIQPSQILNKANVLYHDLSRFQMLNFSHPCRMGCRIYRNHFHQFKQTSARSIMARRCFPQPQYLAIFLKKDILS